MTCDVKVCAHAQCGGGLYTRINPALRFGCESSLLLLAVIRYSQSWPNVSHVSRRGAAKASIEKYSVGY